MKSQDKQENRVAPAKNPKNQCTNLAVFLVQEEWSWNLHFGGRITSILGCTGLPPSGVSFAITYLRKSLPLLTELPGLHRPSVEISTYFHTGGGCFASLADALCSPVGLKMAPAHQSDNNRCMCQW